MTFEEKVEILRQHEGFCEGVLPPRENLPQGARWANLTVHVDDEQALTTLNRLGTLNMQVDGMLDFHFSEPFWNKWEITIHLFQRNRPADDGAIPSALPPVAPFELDVKRFAEEWDRLQQPQQKSASDGVVSGTSQ